MSVRRRVEITIERRELSLSAAGQAATTELCPSCQCEVNMLPVDVAAKASGISPRILYRWIEQDRVHYRELADGSVLICKNSIPRQ